MEAPEPLSPSAIDLFETLDIVVVVRRYLAGAVIIVEVVNDDWKGWPEMQIFPDRRSMCAYKIEVKAAWR